LNFSML